MNLRTLAPRLLGCLLFTMFFCVPAALAQSDDGNLIFDVAGISDGCGDSMSPDDCMASGDTTQTLCTRDACPACAFDQTMTRSICYKLYGASGYCSCTGANNVAYDRNGNKTPNCATSGSCVNQRR